MAINTKKIDEIIYQIEKIKRLNLQLIGYDKVYSEIKKLMDGYTTLRFPASNNTIYRVRRNENERDKSNQFKLFEHVDNLWAPKPENIGKYGRANIPGHPVFYCSNSEGTAIAETSIREGDWITIMHCRNKCDLINMKTVGIGFKDEAEFKSKDEVNKTYIKNWGRHKLTTLRHRYSKEHTDNNSIQECLLKNKLIDDFLNAEFRKQVNSDECDFEYKITAAIASLYLDPNPLYPSSISLDGIAYPTIKGQTSAPNWVFTIEAANRFFRPYYFKIYEIGKIAQERNEKKYYGKLKFKSRCIKQTGEIDWEKHP